MILFNLIRFKIKVQVEDNSDDVPLILFHPLVDEIIEKVVLKSAEQLFQENTTPVCINHFSLCLIFFIIFSKNFLLILSYNILIHRLLKK